MQYSIVDTHCHLDLIQSQGQEISLSLEKAIYSGVKKLIQIGIDFSSSTQAEQISENNILPIEIYFTIGAHPCHKVSKQETAEIAKLIEQKVTHPKFVGIGEIGLDYYHSKDDWTEQEEIFRNFIEISIQKSLPIVVHSRDAAEATVKVLKEYKDKAFGVIHCFTYNLELAREFCKLGYYISFSGILTFKNAKDIQQAAREIPLENILLETDSPFLAPTPYRGKRNEPSYMPHILEFLFQIRKEQKTKIEEQVYENSLNFIHKKAALC
jgi:TatD DNase family protein